MTQDIVERVARAIYCDRSALQDGVARAMWGHESSKNRDWYLSLARAAIAAMLDGLEPVAWRYDDEDKAYALQAQRAAYGDYPYWTETPIYDLSPLKEALK